MIELMNLYFNEMDKFHQSDIYTIIEKYSKEKEYNSIMTPIFKEFMQTHRIRIVGITCASGGTVGFAIIGGAIAFFSLPFPGLLFSRVKRTKKFKEKYCIINGIEDDKKDDTIANTSQDKVEENMG
ncbi:Plasmodium exported protein, unknown function [Plasmodium sp. gorilla clade G2]|uniref:Plasmodium exported protein, unknown function n=1 Tax=Plasmodium sp. gorilla clade G2 TaxID=880535 RepID=UPI000D273D1B|nr:Plasmodium exported protein, unknown function [Plasmodium sp. gorilla clade G2]SOV20277.1 Plasmodium exported protein, unknown function [Plasmodium sp. gorilla clade G2]